MIKMQSVIIVLDFLIVNKHLNKVLIYCLLLWLRERVKVVLLILPFTPLA